jgi:acyl-CoA synthetase (AMP-forming)/AMP-acid ligase II
MARREALVTDEESEVRAVFSPWVASIADAATGSITVYRDGSPSSHGARDILHLASEVADALTSAGIAKGDRVALLCEDGIEWVAADVAVQALGAVSVCLDPRLVDLVDWAAEPSLRAMVVDRSVTAKHLLDRLGSAPAPSLAVVVEPSLLEPVEGTAFLQWESFVVGTERSPDGGRPEHRVVPLDAADPASVMWEVAFTGDTPSLKRRTYTHGQLQDVAAAWQRRIAPRADDACVSVLPLTVEAGRAVGELVPLAGGSASIVHPDFHQRDLEHSRPTVVVATGVFWARVADSLQAKYRQLQPQPERLWGLRSGLLGAAAVLTILRGLLPGGLASGTQYLALACGTAASLAAVPGYVRPDSERYRPVRPMAFLPGVLAVGYLVTRQLSADSWSQFLDFAFGLVVVLAAAALVVGRLKWWNSRLWSRPVSRANPLRRLLWERPLQARLGLDRCRLALCVLTGLPVSARTTLAGSGATIHEVQAAVDPTEA